MILVKYEKKCEYIEAVYQLFIDFKKDYFLITREILHNKLIEFHIDTKVFRRIKFVSQKAVAQCVCARICLTCLLVKWSEKKEMHYQNCFQTLSYWGSGKPG
jgi:hypothetical protein